ncbi:ATP-binding protein [Erythrobacter sp.]|uniref:ATP-binding protein n=1 Tax=Erythrobacter sp. TaxID=1042 RepID=UPI001B02774E|nr:ATP-binding protein [Erythrobacter sp.]MBO6527390.1 PAS domain S-box protein [Erythrobacter sp.]MBO6530774.1 PAS domain S-box protein [Erythrobacter sp.]
MAWSIYSANIAADRANAAEEIDIANAAAAGTLEREIALIAETEEKAAATMARKLEQGGPTDLDDVFVRAADGAFHTRDELWTGQRFPGAIRLTGIGGFLAPPEPLGERRAAILAAFETLKQMSNGLPSRIESLYFFSQANDLLIYAPRRPDQLSFYRSAPADFDFQGSEFSRITSPANNPEGELRCTSLQRPAYDESGELWTTGCMLPVRVDGRHLGAWGISIPLEDLTQKLRPPPDGAYTVIVSRSGKMIHHSSAAGTDNRQLAANLDLANSQDDHLRALWSYVRDGIENRTDFAQGLDAYVSARQLDAPEWYVLTLLPEQALSDRAWSVARRVILVALVGALVLGLLLAAVFHRTVALRIARLGTRIDRVAAMEGMDLDAGTSDEIRQLEHAFDQMEHRLALARSRERRSFDVLVDAAERYAMILFDERGRLLRASKGAVDLFGEDEVAELAARWGLATEGDVMPDLADRPGPKPSVIERTLADGRRVWLEEALVALEDEAGAPFGTAYIGHDITDQQNAAQALLRARDAARAEARAKTDILAVIAHEIRTPVAGILGLIDQVRRERSESERSRALTLIEDSSEALLKTLDATLQRTRSEREETVSQVEEFQPAALVERVAELFRPLARRKGLALDVVTGSDGLVIGQPTRIQQILANFVSNAIKFTSTGKVTLSFDPPEKDSEIWTFSVEDTGAGIDPERLKTIFEPFSGSAPDTLGRSTGSGLGLSITRDLAQQMGGTVAARIGDKGGTRMDLALPLEAVTHDDVSSLERGVVAVGLTKASLALRVEVIAHRKGFAIFDPAASDAEIANADMLVTDDPEPEIEPTFKLQVIVVESGEAARRGGVLYATEADLLDMLPDLLDEVADG